MTKGWEEIVESLSTQGQTVSETTVIWKFVIFRAEDLKARAAV